VNSVRERILCAVLELLQPVARAAGATLHRSPAVALRREQCPALVVLPESDAIAERANDRVTHELSLRIVALARETFQASGEALADRLLAAAHAALFLDVNLGGLALGIRELDVEWDIEDADAVAVALNARYRITYRTLHHDITQPG
jgi:hypothetical protein